MSKQSVKKTETTAPKTPKTAKTPKMTKTEVVEIATPAPTPAPSAAKKTSKKQVSVKVEPVPVTPVETTETVPATTETVSSIAGDYSEFMNKLQQISTLMSGLKSEFRQLEKRASRELKTATKASAKRKRKTGTRAPSGFVKPTLISNELATFLGRETGSEMARTEVTREINAYIREHKLQDKTNGRRIIADAKLMDLLKVTLTDELTYFNLQRYMSPHFAKAGAAPAATAAANVVVA